MTRITPEVLLGGNELAFEFYRSSGPGGQNVNKVSTAVRLRFDVRNSRLLAPSVKERLTRLAGRRLTEAGVLVIEAQRFRTQERNRREAIERLVEMIRRAEERPRERRATRPTAGSRERRIEAKKRRGAVKTARRASHDPTE
jgi:ribosome-associated protein